jgi:hypothetical protein
MSHISLRLRALQLELEHAQLQDKYKRANSDDLHVIYRVHKILLYSNILQEQQALLKQMLDVVTQRDSVKAQLDTFNETQ